MSVSFANLVNTSRYRAHNLKLYGLTPGPTEFTADQLQHFMKNLVDELIKLYEDGIFIKTPLYPQGASLSYANIVIHSLLTILQCRATYTGGSACGLL